MTLGCAKFESDKLIFGYFFTIKTENVGVPVWKKTWPYDIAKNIYKIFCLCRQFCTRTFETCMETKSMQTNDTQSNNTQTNDTPTYCTINSFQKCFENFTFDCWRYLVSEIYNILKSTVSWCSILKCSIKLAKNTGIVFVLFVKGIEIFKLIHIFLINKEFSQR